MKKEAKKIVIHQEEKICLAAQMMKKRLLIFV